MFDEEDFRSWRGRFACDWFTGHSTQEPTCGKIWEGGVKLGRFERIGTWGQLRAHVAIRHQRYTVSLTGQPLRNGASIPELLKDVWLGAPVTVQRIDWAWEEDRLSDYDVGEVARIVKSKLPYTRYGWGETRIDSDTGTTVYLGAFGRPGEDSQGNPADRLKESGGKPLFVRVYRKVGQKLRIEAECKQLSGQPLAEAVRATAEVSAQFMPGRQSFPDEDGAWSDLPPEARVVHDARAMPEKLVRQAYGLLKAAALRAGRLNAPDGLANDAVHDKWVSVVYYATGVRVSRSVERVLLAPVPGTKQRAGRLVPVVSGNPAVVTQGTEIPGIDLARPVPLVRSQESQYPPSSPMGDFYRYFCGLDT